MKNINRLNINDISASNMMIEFDKTTENHNNNETNESIPERVSLYRAS